MNAQQIIARALRLLGVYQTGEAPTGAEAQDALSVFNSMIQGLSNEPLAMFTNTTTNVLFTAGTGSRTFGPSGQVVAARPVAVLNNTYLRAGDVSTPLVPLTPWDWADIRLKDLITGYPTSIYVEPNYPDITIHLYPAPTQDVTLVLATSSRLITLASLTQDLPFPDGYDRMFAYMLAVELAPEYERVVTPDLRIAATSARRSIKRANLQVPRLNMPNGIPGGWSWPGSGYVGGGNSGDVLIPVP